MIRRVFERGSLVLMADLAFGALLLLLGRLGIPWSDAAWYLFLVAGMIYVLCGIREDAA